MKTLLETTHYVTPAYEHIKYNPLSPITITCSWALSPYSKRKWWHNKPRWKHSKLELVQMLSGHTWTRLMVIINHCVLPSAQVSSVVSCLTDRFLRAMRALWRHQSLTQALQARVRSSKHTHANTHRDNENLLIQRANQMARSVNLAETQVCRRSQAGWVLQASVDNLTWKNTQWQRSDVQNIIAGQMIEVMKMYS